MLAVNYGVLAAKMILVPGSGTRYRSFCMQSMKVILIVNHRTRAAKMIRVVLRGTTVGTEKTFRTRSFLFWSNSDHNKVTSRNMYCFVPARGQVLIESPAGMTQGTTFGMHCCFFTAGGGLKNLTWSLVYVRNEQDTWLVYLYTAVVDLSANSHSYPKCT